MKYLYTYIFTILLMFSCGKKEVKKETVKDENSIVKDFIEETVNVVEEVPELIFTVQVAALRNKNAAYKSIENMRIFNEENLFKYRLGQFATYQEASAYRVSLLNRYSGAFIQALKNGEPINIKQALK